MYDKCFLYHLLYETRTYSNVSCPIQYQACRCNVSCFSYSIRHADGPTEPSELFVMDPVRSGTEKDLVKRQRIFVDPLFCSYKLHRCRIRFEIIKLTKNLSICNPKLSLIRDPENPGSGSRG
jgi:hypothetical protein